MVAILRNTVFVTHKKRSVRPCKVNVCWNIVFSAWLMTLGIVWWTPSSRCAVKQIFLLIRYNITFYYTWWFRQIIRRIWCRMGVAVWRNCYVISCWTFIVVWQNAVSVVHDDTLDGCSAAVFRGARQHNTILSKLYFLVTELVKNEKSSKSCKL